MFTLVFKTCFINNKDYNLNLFFNHKQILYIQARVKV